MFREESFFNKSSVRLQVRSVGSKEERPKKNKDKVNTELVRSLVEGDLYENDELDEMVKRLQNYQEAIPIIPIT